MFHIICPSGLSLSGPDPALRPVLLASPKVFRLLPLRQTTRETSCGWLAGAACGENWAQILRAPALHSATNGRKASKAGKIRESKRSRDGDNGAEDDNMTAEQAPPEAGCAVDIAADADDEHDAEEAATAPLSPTAGKPPPSPSPRGGCCRRAWDYGGVPEARGYALLAMGRGMAVMSNGASRPCRRFRGVRLRRGFSATLWQ